jgi:hypothetical protein
MEMSRVCAISAVTRLAVGAVWLPCPFDALCDFRVLLGAEEFAPIAAKGHNIRRFSALDLTVTITAVLGGTRSSSPSVSVELDAQALVQGP